MSKKRYVLLFVAAVGILTSACNRENSGAKEDNQPHGDISIWQSSDPVMLNPMNTTDASSRRISERVFQTLIQMDYFTYELVPVLAKSRPIIKENPDGSSTMEFEIREEAVWDDTGKPITGYDVAFTLKVMKTPKVNSEAVRLYYEYITDIIVDEKQPKRFTLVCKEPYMIQEGALGDLYIYPAHIYDAENMLADFSVAQLAAGGSDLDSNLILTKFAERFNAPVFQNEIVVGSGPYELEEWKSEQKVVLKRKTNWWGDAVKEENIWFDAYPARLIYRTINDANTAVSALKSGDLDIMYRIDPRIFVEELRKDTSFTARFEMGTPTQFIYSYIGMNTKSPALADAQTRRALRHLMDVDYYSESVFYGLSERVTTFIHPSKKQFINEKIKLQEFNIEKAKEMLAAAGWSDSNADGILDKKVGGKRIDFKMQFLYPSVAVTSEKGVLIFQEACKKVGIELILAGMDFGIMMQRLQKHEFDMYFGLWQAAPLESDPTQVWHTKSANGGNNYVNFGNAKSDAILEKLTRELNEAKRATYYKELQQIIDDEAPYIFLLASKNRLAVTKKAKNVKFTGMGDGYWVQGLVLEAAAEQ